MRKTSFAFCILSLTLLALSNAGWTQCRRGEILTDAGCTSARSPRRPPKPPIVSQPTVPPSSSTPEGRKQITKLALHAVFANEEKQNPKLKQFLDDESGGPFKRAYATENKNWFDLEVLINVITSERAAYFEIRDLITPPSPANIGTISPTSGKEGETITLYGSNFDKVQSVLFSNNIAAQFKVQIYSGGQRSEIRVTIPAGAQSGPIQVINPAGAAKVQVTILETAKPPVISSFNPQEGSAGDSLTIQGDQFKTVRQVLFNCQQSWAGRVFCEEGKFEIVSPTQLRVTVPTGVSGSREIVVINDVGEAKTAQGFRIRTSPSIREIHPAEGYPGDIVSIIGTNLNNLKSITFNGQTLSANSADAWQIKVTIPEESSDGNMVVTTIDGTAQSPTLFRVKKRPPVITNVQPRSGYPGDVVTISGDHFKNVTTVKFDEQSGTIVNQSKTEIRVNLPNAVGTHTVKVVAPEGEGVWYSNLFVIATPPPPPPPPQPNPIQNPVSTPEDSDKNEKNKLGKYEYCFGAVGNSCFGFGNPDGSTKSTQPGWLAAGCSEEVDGKRNCVVTPGSIKHDNCCFQDPQGRMCGGPYKNDTAGYSNNDGNCVQEWDDAQWDVKNVRGWIVEFDAHKPAELGPTVSSTRYPPGEAPASATLCAPDGANLSARHSVDFCCSHYADRYWSIGVEDWITCTKKPGFSLQSLFGGGGKKKADGPPPPGFTPGKPPPKPESKPTMAPAKSQPRRGGGGEITPASIETAPPPPLLPTPAKPKTTEQKRIEQQEAQKKKQLEQEEALQRKQQKQMSKPAEPKQEEASASRCRAGSSWSPTLKTCIEDQAPEEAAPPDCGAGAHWSPTLKSCQPD